MRPVDQTKFGAEGNCTAACIASILELALDDIPDFGDDPLCEKLSEWLRPMGLYAACVALDPKFPRWVPEGYHMLGGESPGGPHHVVARGKDIVHDPNPNRAGLVTREDVILFIPIDPARSLR